MSTSAQSENTTERWERPKNDFAQSLGRLQQQLDLVWQAIGLDDEQIDRRVSRVFEILREVTSEMLTQERSLLKSLERNVNEYQSRLKSLYSDLHTEYESPTLGPTLLSKEIELKKLVTSLEQRKKKSLLEWTRLIKIQTSICEKLSEAAPIIEICGTPTLNQLESLTQSIVSLEQEYKSRHAKFLILKNEIKSTLDLMEIKKAPPEIESLLDNNSILSLKNLNTLSNYKDILNKDFSEIKTKIDRLWVSIEFMWNLLEIRVSECENFKKSNTKFSETVLKNLKTEDLKLKNIRKEKLSAYIPKLKDKLVVLWNKCRFGPHKREQFLIIYNDKISEESLLAHEEALLGAHAYYEENAKILDQVEKRDEMWEVFRRLELGQSGMDKYQNRGGALLKEEKVRRTIAKELPRIEADIEGLVLEWAQKHNAPFLIDDIPFKEYVSLQNEALKAEKDERRRVRINSRTVLETPLKRVNNTVISNRLNSTTSRSRICATDTCDRTKRLDPILRLTPIKRRSSLLWPNEDSFVARNSRGREVLKQKEKENEVLKESNMHNRSPNIAIVTPVITSNVLKNADKSLVKPKLPIQKFKVWDI